MNKNNPCKDCADRHVGCHGTCPTYIEWSEKRKAEKQQILEAKNKTQPYENYRQASITAMYRRKRSKGEA